MFVCVLYLFIYFCSQVMNYYLSYLLFVGFLVIIFWPLVNSQIKTLLSQLLLIHDGAVSIWTRCQHFKDRCLMHGSLMGTCSRYDASYNQKIQVWTVHRFTNPLSFTIWTSMVIVKTIPKPRATNIQCVRSVWAHFPRDEE